ncbi:flagellar associated protein [Monoraphidium neglectum]|uniref:Flagellar associated protein n=1 Tax=Monoraphidium neglectum TaxID=145388 RepID=A0A0D2LSI3_9CHLO|nr:flagellar associated protein [Monoraphidium neglectum]KIY92746.1 flagellar associated protein [Monoraphidium neglectum]|eukprot:XP_013891766.1 flagellar associated protein [Monoraphidium neglectum]
MEKEAAQRAVANAAKKKKAEERISNALSQNEAILHQKRQDFEEREAASEVRRREMEEERRAADERKRAEEERQQAERRGKYELSLQREEERKQDIKGRAARKQQLLDEADSARSSANSQRRVERELFNGLRRDKVDSIQKMQAYQRQLLLERIMEENEKTARMLEQRQAIQEQRKSANMNASMHRNKARGRWGGDAAHCGPADGVDA